MGTKPKLKPYYCTGDSLCRIYHDAFGEDVAPNEAIALAIRNCELLHTYVERGYSFGLRLVEIGPFDP